MRVPHRDPRRDRKAIGRATRSRELTPEEQILALHSMIGNAAVTDLLGQSAAAGAADAKIMQHYEGTSQIQRLVIARETLLPRRVEEPAAAIAAV